jgi:hypothetical protein
MRRVGLIVLAPFFLFGLVDGVRVLLARTPRLVAADEYTPGFSREHITAHGLGHIESAVAYNISTYRESRAFGEPIKVEPFALIPLNRPERSEGRVLLAEVPLVNDELPEDMLDRDRFEFTGLAGAIPDDLRGVIAKDFPRDTKFSRVQVRLGPPSLGVSFTLMLMPALLFGVMLWRARVYEASEDAHLGAPQKMSGFLLLLGLPLAISVVWLRLRWDPEADSIGLVVAAFAWMLLWLPMAFALRGLRQDPREEEDSEAPEEQAEPERLRAEG